MAQLTKLIISLTLSGLTSYTFADYPIVSHRYLADPGSLVYNGRLYLYCSNDDENPFEGGYKMRSIVCVSTIDLKNWTDHGIVFQVPQGAPWAENSWAPSAIERDGKFFLYFGNGGNGIGVATADCPTGPFTDPLKEKLISTNTPGVLPANNMWLFDPMAFVDDDGQAYVYFGGNGENNMRIIRLNKDMVSIDDQATQFPVPFFFEASWMHKHNGKYYFTYSTNPSNGIRIDYMVSDNPLSGFTYGGVVSQQPPNNYNNNHHSIFKFNENWYQAYHNRIVAEQAGVPTGYKRNLCLDQIYHNDDGSIKTMVNSVDGVAQIGYLNPFVRVEAETMKAQNGIKTEVCSEGGMNITDIEDGDWIKVQGVDFGAYGPASFTANIASDIKVGDSKGGSIEIWIDSLNGTLIGTVPVSFTGGIDLWKPETIAIKTITGIHDLYFIFKGSGSSGLFKFDYWFFSKKTNTQDLIAINAEVDDYKIDTVTGYNTTKITTTAIYSDGTSKEVTSESTLLFSSNHITPLEDGKVKGKNYGSVNAKAIYNNAIDSFMVVVKDLESELTVSRIYANVSDYSLFTGSSKKNILFAEYLDGHTEDISNKADYNNPSPEIADLSNGNITAHNEGEVQITASYQGEQGKTKHTTINVSVTNGSGVWLEAECGSVGSLWEKISDESASNGGYVSIQPGNSSSQSAPTSKSGLITYDFNIEASGTFKVYARVICPSATDDSFWLKMDNGPFEKWNNITPSTVWTWAIFTSTYDLNAGDHNFTIGYREDGAKLDKLWITNIDSELPDEGAVANNCD